MTEDLKLKKLCAPWVSHLLGLEEKQQRINKARDLLQLFNCRRQNLWITGDESWLMFHQMESSNKTGSVKMMSVRRLLGSLSSQGNGCLQSSLAMMILN